MEWNNPFFKQLKKEIENKYLFHMVISWYEVNV